MDSKEVLTLIQLALGKASVAFMSQTDGGKIVMPTEELLETANELCEAIMAMARKDYARIAELEAECARLTTERGADLNRRIMQAFKDAEEARLRLLGVLAILVEDGIISSGRARELGAIGVDEQRAYLSQVMPGPAAGEEG